MRGGDRHDKLQRGFVVHFDSSGLDGDGPARDDRPRPHVQLATDCGHRAITVQRRRVLLHRFDDWLTTQFAVSLAALW